jgi:7-cyano-7-deazaguanine synthase
MAEDAKRAVILLSGGLDSATTLAIAVSEGFEPCTLTFRYGQRHSIELTAAYAVANRFKVRTRLEMDLSLDRIGGSALTDSIPVPKNVAASKIGKTIPVTYVPGRNVIFLAYAAAWAESLGSSDIFIGVNARDYSGYPDCRPEFIEAFERMINLGTKSGAEGRPFSIHTPLISLSKAEIIRKGVKLGVDYGMTHSCYDPDGSGRACGQCDSCLIRRRGFEEAGVPDPTKYA